MKLAILVAVSALALSTFVAAQSGPLTQLRYTIDGAAAGDQVGLGISSSADLDGDALADWVVGVARPETAAGSVWAIRGADGSVLWTIDDQTYSNKPAHFGQAVELVGDLDGDGVSDLVVGAPQADSDKGRIDVFSSKSQVPLYSTKSPSPLSARFGNTVTELGDINSDFVPDYLVSAGSEVWMGLRAVGFVRALDGSSGSEIYSMHGTHEFDYFGTLKVGRDINGDGILEGLSYSPQWYSFGGNPDGPGSIRFYDGSTGAVILAPSGSASGDLLGMGAGLIEDVSGDGIHDIVVAAPESDIYGTDRGAVLILSGVDLATVRMIAPPSFCKTEFGAGTEFGTLAILPDLDGDSFEEIAVGMIYAYDPAVGPSSTCGAVGIFSGATGDLLETVWGEGDGDQFGGAVRCVRGLAAPDSAHLVVGARHWNGNRGRAYLYDLRPSPGTITTYCTPAAPNSVSPTGAKFKVTGTASLTWNDLVFKVVDVPPIRPGIFFYGPYQKQIPFGNGYACVGGAVTRIMPVQFSSSSGVVTYPVDLTRPPFFAGPGQILPGSTWNFQFWYRDPGGGLSTFNLSNAVKILFGL